MKIDRRNFIASAFVFSSTSAAAFSNPYLGTYDTGISLNRSQMVDPAIIEASSVRPSLFLAALGALEQNKDIVQRDRLAIVDFSAPSSVPRFHMVNLIDGNTISLLVSHGIGSDPAHTGWLQQFSNVSGSNATSEGAYATSAYYEGHHGRSQRLIGLDSTNCNARERAIVIHGAWYAEPEIVAEHGKLGRSQGCLAIAQSELSRAFEHLGEGRLIYAGRIGEPTDVG